MQKHDLPRKGYKLSGNQWYFVPKIIPTYCEKKNDSSDREKL